MNVNEAIEVLSDFDKQVSAKADGEYQSTIGEMACTVAIKALEEIQKYRAMEKRLEAIYGDCPGLLEIVVEHLERHDGIGIDRPAFKARLLTDDNVDKWDSYKEIGTVEEIKQKLAELERWHTTEVNPKIKNVFANTSTQICHNCDHKDEYIEELEAEIEECREAVEKQMEIRNKAIDDFESKLIMHLSDWKLSEAPYNDDETDRTRETICETIENAIGAVEEIAERLKGGGVNE